MTTRYKNTDQRHMVIKGVRALLAITFEQKGGRVLSKETLERICTAYADLVDSPDGPGTDRRYEKLDQESSSVRNYRETLDELLDSAVSEMHEEVDREIRS